MRVECAQDLMCLGRPLADSIIVDNSPHSYVFQPENALPIGTFIDDPNDREVWQPGSDKCYDRPVHPGVPCMCMYAYWPTILHAITLALCETLAWDLQLAWRRGIAVLGCKDAAS